MASKWPCPCPKEIIIGVKWTLGIGGAANVAHICDEYEGVVVKVALAARQKQGLNFVTEF